MSSSSNLHPCQSCGACCASFRVAFHWREAELGSNHHVPVLTTEDLNHDLRCMKGTNDKHHPKCIALVGRVGQNAQCKIYLNRPTPCRNFTASFENGFKQPRCDEARAKHGLKPLSPRDFPTTAALKEILE